MNEEDMLILSVDVSTSNNKGRTYRNVEKLVIKFDSAKFSALEGPPVSLPICDSCKTYNMF